MEGRRADSRTHSPCAQTPPRINSLKREKKTKSLQAKTQKAKTGKADLIPTALYCFKNCSKSGGEEEYLQGPCGKGERENCGYDALPEAERRKKKERRTRPFDQYGMFKRAGRRPLHVREIQGEGRKSKPSKCPRAGPELESGGGGG